MTHAGDDVTRTLHMVWVGSSVPEWAKRNMRAWQDLHPSWHVQVWGDGDLDWMRHADIIADAHHYVRSSLVGQLCSDIARYEILHAYGGLYVDCDTFPLRPVDVVLAGRAEMAAAEDDTWIANTYLYAREPGHAVFARMLDRVWASVENGARRGWRPNRMTGPRVLTPVWREYGGYVAPRAWFFPYSYADVRRRTVPVRFGDEVVAVHEWANTRRHHRV